MRRFAIALLLLSGCWPPTWLDGPEYPQDVGRVMCPMGICSGPAVPLEDPDGTPGLTLEHPYLLKINGEVAWDQCWELNTWHSPEPPQLAYWDGKYVMIYSTHVLVQQKNLTLSLHERPPCDQEAPEENEPISIWRYQLVEVTDRDENGCPPFCPWTLIEAPQVPGR